MSLALLIYFADVANSISGFLTVFGVMLLLAHVMATFVFNFKNIDNDKELVFYKWPIFIYVPMFLIAIVIPSQKAIYMMIAADGIQKATQNERVQALAENSLTLIEQTIGKYINQKESK